VYYKDTEKVFKRTSEIFIIKTPIKLPNKRAMITGRGKETRILIHKTHIGRAFWISNNIRKQTEQKIRGPN
jgi:hypothetical protein